MQRTSLAVIAALLLTSGAPALASTAGSSFAPPKPKPPASGVAQTERQCLAEAIYFEGRSEPLEGQIAIAHVVLNRVASKTRPNQICGVLAEGVERGKGRCQFGFRCDGRPDKPRDPGLWRTSLAVADKVLAGATVDPTFGAQHFHIADASPLWTASLRETVRIGAHVYYSE